MVPFFGAKNLVFYALRICFIFVVILPLKVYSQVTNNSSSLTNSAAPSASSVTSGGTNINYQTNNTYQNEFGFAPGIFCRTPTLFVGGNFGEGSLRAYDPIQTSGNLNQNYSVNAGIAIPFGSSILEYCKQLASSIAKDREISSQLSMLRTCAQLEKEGLTIDPEKYPLLKPCVKSISSAPLTPPSSAQNAIPTHNLPPIPSLRPKTTRVL